jgi:predicted glycosyltransferase involved in capsule biosynthesis
MKFDLKNTTFVIPVRIDTTDRLENLQILIDYLNKYIDSNFIVVESDIEPKVPEDSRYTKLFFKDETFHRTLLLNRGFRETSTPYVINQDVDALVNPKAWFEAVQELQKNPDCVFVYPYDGSFWDVGEQKQLVKETLSLNNVTILKGSWMHNNSVGGIIVANKDLYSNMGYENTNFKHYGWEDDERLVRANKFGYKTLRLPYVLWHLSHPRPPTEFYQKASPHELQRISNMSLKEIKQDIPNWER